MIRVSAILIKMTKLITKWFPWQDKLIVEKKTSANFYDCVFLKKYLK